MTGKSWTKTAIGSIALFGGVAMAAEPSYDELKAQVEQLSARLERIERNQTAVSQAEVDSTAKAVKDDAARHSQLLAPGEVVAGYDKGFFIKSADGKFLIRPGVQLQFRNVSTIRESSATTDDDFQNGFEIRRLRLRLEGNAFTPDLTYSFVWDSARSGGTTSILDAWAAYKFAPTWTLKAGQFRESWIHEGDVSDTSQLAVERSLVDAILGGSTVDRVQGLSLIYGAKDQPLRAEVTFHDGANSKNTDFRDVQPGTGAGAAPVYSANFGFGGRVEYKVSGAWENYRDFTAKGTKEDLLVFGAGVDSTQDGDNTVYRTTADVQWENTTGWGAYAAVNGNFSEVAGDDRFDWGALAQISYLTTPEIEVFGRYDVVSFDDDFVTGEDLFNEFTIGANYYLGDQGSYLHRAKFTVDLIYLPDGAPSNQTGVGILTSTDSEIVIRGQFTLVL